MNSLSSISCGVRPALSAILVDIGRNPKRILWDSWNWKAAALSVLLRAPIYMMSTARHGVQAIATAGIIESLFRVAITGIDASITQAIEAGEPQWGVAVILLAFLPVSTLLLDALVHWMAATPNLRVGLVVSLAVSIVSSGFNWYSMRRGALLVGPTAPSFGADLPRIPILIMRFLIEPVLILWSGMRAVFSRSPKRLRDVQTKYVE